MLVSDILKSCSHGYVAEAAVASIGGEFADRMRSCASERGQTVGDFTAHHVRRFARLASERDWRVVTATMRGEDLALLAGLRAVVLRMIDDTQGERSSSMVRAEADQRVSAIAA